MESKGASSPRSLSARSILPYSARIALSDVLKTKDLDKDKEKKSISSGTLYVGMSEARLVGFRASAPFKHEITLPTKNRKQESSTASYDFSNKVRTLKMYESVDIQTSPSISIASQMLGLYIDRIRTLRIYGNEADPASLEQQRELLGNYLAFEGQLIPSIKHKFENRPN